MRKYKFILEQTSTDDFTYADSMFFETLDYIIKNNADGDLLGINNYYDQLRKYISYIKEASPALSEKGKNVLNKNISKINEIFKQTNQLSSTMDPILYDSVKEDLSSVWKGVYATSPTTAATATAGATTPAAGGGGAAPAIAAAGAATPAVAQAATGGGTPAATAQGVNKTALFQKYMGSYDPNSSMDKAKMGLVDQALETFKKENKTDFTGSAEDITKMNKIMNNVYQSKEYSGIVKGGGTAAASGAAKTTGQPTVKFGKQDMPTFIQVANGKFIPATQKDVEAGNQIWMRNPRKGQGEDQKPNYVQVRTEKGASLRPKSQLPGALGSVSNLLGDIGRTLDKTSREPRKPSSKK